MPIKNQILAGAAICAILSITACSGATNDTAPNFSVEKPQIGAALPGIPTIDSDEPVSGSEKESIAQLVTISTSESIQIESDSKQPFQQSVYEVLNATEAAGQPIQQPVTEVQPTQLPAVEVQPAEHSSEEAQAIVLPTTEAQPTEQTTAEVQLTEQPTAEVQPTKQPAAEVQLTEQPTAEVQPTEHPAAEAQPTEQPTAEVQLTEQPTAEVQPTEQPAAEAQPAEQPAAKAQAALLPEVEVQSAQPSESDSQGKAPSNFTEQPEPESVSALTKYITIGNDPGDAQCLVFGDSNIPFGSASLSDWGDWLQGDPRFFIGREFLAIEDDETFEKILRQRFVPGHTGTDWVAMGANLPGYRTYRLVQSVFLEEGWDWGGDKYQHQGGKMGFGFGSGTYPTGGKNDPYGFTARIMWRGNRDDNNGRIALYSYAADRTTEYGQDFDIDDMPIGEWVELTIEVTANSSINESDGGFRAWIDGELKLELHNMGWQLAGEQPLVDQLFYMGFYGGNSTDWSPDGITHMRMADVCWAPVVDGYSGIDPDAGITKVNPKIRNRFLFNDQSGQVKTGEMGEIGLFKRSLLNVIGENILQFDLASEVDSFSLMSLLNQSSTSFNEFEDIISGVTHFNLPENPIASLRAGLHSAQSARSTALSEGRIASVGDFEVSANRVNLIAGLVSDVAISALKKNLELQGCSGQELTVHCAITISILADVSLLRDEQKTVGIESDQSLLISEQIWELVRTVQVIPQ